MVGLLMKLAIAEIQLENSNKNCPESDLKLSPSLVARHFKGSHTHKHTAGAQHTAIRAHDHTVKTLPMNTQRAVTFAAFVFVFLWAFCIHLAMSRPLIMDFASRQFFFAYLIRTLE